jgi:hypothetical protein
MFDFSGLLVGESTVGLVRGGQYGQQEFTTINEVAL